MDSLSPVMSEQGIQTPPHILIVDANQERMQQSSAALSSDNSCLLLYATDIDQARHIINQEHIRLVLLDVHFDPASLFGLIGEINHTFTNIPVLLQGNKEDQLLIARCLQRGATNFIIEDSSPAALKGYCVELLTLAEKTREQKRLVPYWGTTQFEFVIENDTSLISALVEHYQDYLFGWNNYDPAEKMKVGVALHEAIRNSIHHGNLELDSALREDDWDKYYELAETRRYQEPYKNRKVRIITRHTPEESVFVIQDQGTGFDTKAYIDYDPRDTENLNRSSGRGIFLIRSFMHEVKFNDSGNEITMIYHRSNAKFPDGIHSFPIPGYFQKVSLYQDSGNTTGTRRSAILDRNAASQVSSAARNVPVSGKQISDLPTGSSKSISQSTTSTSSTTRASSVEEVKNSSASGILSSIQSGTMKSVSGTEPVEGQSEAHDNPETKSPENTDIQQGEPPKDQSSPNKSSPAEETIEYSAISGINRLDPQESTEKAMNMSIMQVTLESKTEEVANFKLSGKVSKDGWPINRDPLVEKHGPGLYSKPILLSLESVEHIDSTGVEWFLAIHTRAQKSGGIAILHSPNPFTEQLLKMMRMDLTLNIVQTPEQANKMIEEKIHNQA